MTWTGVALAVVLLGVLTTVFATFLLVLLGARTVRRGRRHYDVFRARGSELFPAWNPATLGAVVTTTVGSPSWWLVQQRRHRMWRAVTSCESAVAVAQRTGAPVGELPSLVRRLRSAADRVDAQLRASTALGSRDAGAAASGIEAAAADLQGAAEDAVRITAADESEPLRSAIRLEVAALAAGVRAASVAATRRA
jgi:hypothetical protein